MFFMYVIGNDKHSEIIGKKQLTLVLISSYLIVLYCELSRGLYS